MNMIMLVFLIYVGLLSHLTFEQPVSNSDCIQQCVCHENSVDCSRASLHTLNWTIPAYITHVDLSNNNITNINWENFADVSGSLKVLDISNNQFLDLPVPLLRRFTELQVLNASCNKIVIRFMNRRLPLLTNKKLRVLDLRHNNIQTYGASLFSGLPSLTHVYMDHNLVPSFSSTYFDGLPKLHTISLSHNNITNLYFTLYIPVKELNLIGNNFSLMDSMLLLPNITKLEIGRTGLDFFSNSLVFLKNLRHLSIKNFSQTFISSDLFSSSLNLQEFELEGGMVKEIEIKNMKQLYVLNFNRLSNLTTFSVSSCCWLGLFGSVSFGNAPSLTTVNVNNLSKLNEFTQKFFHIDGNNSVILLNLSFNMIQFVSEITFKSYFNLEVLDLGINRIEYVHPKSFSSLTKLRYVNLTGNLLRNIPTNFFLSPTVLNLNLSYNLIRSVSPDWDVQLSCLEEVDLSYNMIGSISIKKKLLPRYNLNSISWNCSCKLWKEFTSNDYERFCQSSSICYICKTPEKYEGQTIYDLGENCQTISTNTPQPFSWVVIALCVGIGAVLLSVAFVVLYKFNLCQCKEE